MPNGGITQRWRILNIKSPAKGFCRALIQKLKVRKLIQLRC
ncbi:hypothetical protein PROVALCAL_01047 [Providencia alcalifaciens DSM 30120]|uniref:Uncharacterized protein n=1 Tax=Providencia alcalifaciens DSM 30120 TaxID=520999 RepID=B6XCI3_9GAMM|nr:hypothetical protein PROVALCAL_01047 [Providencia alcalifaciens DSM 30120]